MSLFGPYVGDYEDDSIFGAHFRQMRQMNHMVNSMFAGGPFGMMGGLGGMPSLMGDMGPPALTAPQHMASQDLMPYGFPPMNMNMNRLYQGMGDLGHSYSSSTMMTMSSGPDGRPQVYQASSSTRTAPGGVREIKQSSVDSRSGVKRMAIGHHIGERAHVLEREQNLHSGDQEERQEFINLEEEEAEDFNQEFERKVRSSPSSAIGFRPSRRHRSPQRALPSTQPSSSSPPPAPKERSRKREHTPDVSPERQHKAPRPSVQTIQVADDSDEPIQIVD